MERKPENSKALKRSEETGRPHRGENSARCGKASIDPVLNLQQTAGNRAVRRLLQAKYAAGAPNDASEKEADRIADAVVGMQTPPRAEMPVMRLKSPGDLTRASAAQALPERGPGPDKQPQNLAQHALHTRSKMFDSPPRDAFPDRSDLGGDDVRPLPDTLRHFFEPRFGHDLRQVRIHTGTRPARHARKLKARAFTIGRDLYFDSGQYTPATTAGRRLMVHELTHVLQQRTERIAGLQRKPSAAEPTSAIEPAGQTLPGLIVADTAVTTTAGQMHKSAFLAQLQTAACQAAEEMLAGTEWTTDSCPYLRFLFRYYNRQDSRSVERAIRRHVPETRSAASAGDLIPLILARVRRGTRRWARTGTVTGIPPEVIRSLPRFLTAHLENVSAERIALKARDGSLRRPGRTAQVRSRLGDGRPLDGRSKARMEAAFGRRLSDVRIHTDSQAARLSEGLNARAFSVGKHIAFSRGQYQPGTLVGDALLAHELAHTLQQGQAPGHPDTQRAAARDDRRLEADADRSAVGAVAGLWSRASDFLNGIRVNARPKLRSGLRLQRCHFFDEPEETRVEPPSEATAEAEAPEAAAPDPEEVMQTFLQGVLSDNRVTPAEWSAIRQRAQALQISEMDLESLLSFEFDFTDNYEELFALFALSDNAAIRQLASGYTARVTSAPRTFTPDPLPLIVDQVLEDSELSQVEFDALRKFSLVFDADRMRAELARHSISDATLSWIQILISLGYSNYRRLVSRSGFFPIRLQAEEGGRLSAATDLRPAIIEIITADNVWHHGEFRIIRSLIGAMRRPDAAAFLAGAGFAPASADLIAREFTRSDDAYRRWVEERTGLRLNFSRAGAQWQLTSQSQQDLALPWHPTLIGPLTPSTPSGEPSRGTGVTSTIESYAFASGRTTRADQFEWRFRGHEFIIIMAEDLIEDPDLMDRIEAALSIIPRNHLNLVRTLVLDPGNDPGGEAIATAARDGTVNLYFSGAGPHVSQSSLNQTTVHEFGHLVSYQAESGAADFWTNWEQAMQDDGRGISRYGFTNKFEDFAESYVLYLSGGRTDRPTRTRYSHRFTIMDPLFRRR